MRIAVVARLRRGRGVEQLAVRVAHQGHHLEHAQLLLVPTGPSRSLVMRMGMMMVVASARPASRAIC